MYNVLLLKDNFENGIWSVVSGKWDYIMDVTKVYHTSSEDSLSRSVIGSYEWKDYSVQTKIKVNGWGSDTFMTAGVLARYVDINNYYIFAFESSMLSEGEAVAQLRIKRKSNGVMTIIASKDYDLALEKYYIFKATVLDNKLIFSVNNMDELIIEDDTLLQGKAGLISCFGDLCFDDFVINKVFDIQKPGPSNTGPTNLKKLVKSNSITITKDNTVLENVDVTGYINVKANNVIIRNFRVTANTGIYYPVRIYDGFNNTLLEDGEINGAAFAHANVYGLNYTARRLNIHNAGGDGFKATSMTTIEKCWIHNLGLLPSAHADGIQVSSGGKIKIIGNNIDMPIDEAGTLSNAAVFIKPDFGNISEVIVDGNWLNGGNYTVYSVDNLKAGVPVFTTKNAIISNNRFGRKYKYWIGNINTDTVWKDNVWDDDGTQALSKK